MHSCTHLTPIVNMSDIALTLVHDNNAELHVPIHVLSQCRVFDRLVEDTDANGCHIPVANIDASTMQHVIKYAAWHRDITDKLLDTSLHAWEDTFFESLPSMSDRLKLILAANYLDFPRLLESAAMCIGRVICETPLERLREVLDVENDYSKEDQVALNNMLQFGLQKNTT